MSKKKTDHEDYLDHLFSALSDRTRRGILNDLSKQESSVSTLAEKYKISLPGIMKHLAVLERAKLVSLEKNGRVRSCHFDPQGFQNAEKYILEYQKFWTAHFDRIEDFLAKGD